MLPIAPSELILNSRGAVYHLDLLPEELALNVITVGDPERVNAVSKHFDQMETERSQFTINFPKLIFDGLPNGKFLEPQLN